jgi:uncharacterized RDD family membrane protein YckC
MLKTKSGGASGNLCGRQSLAKISNPGTKVGNRICSYCGNENDAESMRCQLCGRRSAGGPALVPDHFGNAAPNLDFALNPIPEVPPRKPAPSQGRLFPHQEPRKVLPFDRVSPQASTAGKKILESSARTRALRRANERMGVTGQINHTGQYGQQVFSFPAAEAIRAHPEPRKCANFPVASPVQRLQATLWNHLLILLGLAIFAGILHLWGAEWPVSASDQYIFLGLGVCIVLFYYLIFAIAGADTPGMRVAGLKLVDFYGHAPETSQRVFRVFGTLVSLSSLGMGFLWCLFEAESLTWHDDISSTAPTPIASHRKN